jgi:mannose-6-phosphate isomerase-like protein (cupin superfamily)
MPVNGTATLVDAGAVVARADAGDGVAVKVTLDAAVGCRGVEQRVVRFGSGRSRPRTAACEEVWYVVAGGGLLRAGPSQHRLEPDLGVLLPPGTTWLLDSPGELLVVSVRVPAVRHATASGAAPATPAVVRLADQPAISTGDRELRIVVDPAVGCQGLTQFVGWIPPGRAPAHTHGYDEVVYVLEGRGILHAGGPARPITAGSCVHLPPGVPHCLENDGAAPLRVLGVFHPAGSPAAKAPAASR